MAAPGSNFLPSGTEGGVKDKAGKSRLSFLPWKALHAVADVFVWAVETKGYPKDNWKKVEKQDYLEAAARHLSAVFQGNRYDPQSKKLHLAHLGCCVLVALWHEVNEEEQATKEWNEQ